MPTQNHIHLYTSTESGGENAPLVKWKVTDRLEMPRVTMTAEESLTGRTLRYLLQDQAGTIRYTDYKYTLRVDNYAGYTTDERKAFIDSWLGNILYLVDNVHPDDGQDHAASVKKVLFYTRTPWEVFDQGLTRYYTTIELVHWRD